MLRLEAVDKSFKLGDQSLELFKNLNIEIERGDFIVIIGSNGAGKSSLLNIISARSSIDRGRIILDNRDITDLDESRRCKSMARIFQNPELGSLGDMTIFENLSLAINKGGKFNLSLLLRGDRRKFFKELLEKLEMGLEDKLDTRVSELSGGQRQALALIMAVVTKPELLLLDEHTAALDPKSSEKIMELTNDFIVEEGISSLMVTHNIDHALNYGNRIIMLHRGQILMDLRGQEKKDLTKEKVLSMFKEMSDKILFN